MENNSTIKKINTIGKVSSIVIIIAKIVLLVVAIATLVTGIAMFFVPGDFISADIDATADIYINGEELPFSIASDMEDISDAVQDVDVDFANLTFGITDLSENDKELDLSMIFQLDDIDGKAIAVGMGIACVCASFFLAVVYIIMIFAHKLAKALSTCASPFEENVVKRMKHFAFSMIPWAVLSCFGGSITNGTSGVNVGINIDVVSLLIVAMIILLVYIFDFGAQLQREADETL